MLDHRDLSGCFWHYGSPTLSPLSTQLGDHQKAIFVLLREPKINQTLDKFKNVLPSWVGFGFGACLGYSD
jgi:hypothetical protein